MELFFKNNGFSQGQFPNEWVKKQWTIRGDDNCIEAFEDFGNDYSNRYVILPNTEENLFLIIDTINDL
jgi:hypothetical protein